MQVIGTWTKRKIYPYAEIHRERGKLIIFAFTYDKQT